MLAVALGFGFAFGQIDASSARGVVLVIACLGGSYLLILAWAWSRLVNPWRELADLLEAIAPSDRPERLERLPVHRSDEVGRMARSIRELCGRRIRDRSEAKHLRRTMDDQIGRATKRAVASLKQQAMRDPMTDLGNRRYLDEVVPELLTAATQTGQDVACAVIDMDNFKKVNDTLGHAVGDELIVLLATLLKSSIRKQDIAVRLGGDEFVVMMPGADMRKIDQLFTLLRKLFLQQTQRKFNTQPRPNLSVGLASMRIDKCSDSPSLIERADARLYEAKQQGKGVNCSPLASPDATPKAA